MGYLYVLTNGELLGRKGSDEKAAQFNNTVIHTIAQAVGQPADHVRLINWRPTRFRRAEPWVPKRTFKMVRPGFPASIPPEKDYRIEIYNCKEQKNEVSLVYVLPENVSPTEKLATNIDLSLETLQITGRLSATAGSPEAKAAAGREALEAFMSQSGESDPKGSAPGAHSLARAGTGHGDGCRGRERHRLGHLHEAGTHRLRSRRFSR